MIFKWHKTSQHLTTNRESLMGCIEINTLEELLSFIMAHGEPIIIGAEDFHVEQGTGQRDLSLFLFTGDK